MSIVDPKYRDKYRENPDWLTSVINDHCYDVVTKEKVTKNEDGSETTETVNTKKTSLNLERFLALAEENHIDVAKYRADMDKKNAPGRLRMTVGNMLRAAAKKRHGLHVDGKFVHADKEFIGDTPKTHNPDGTKIAKEVEKAAA